jgi:gluconokinase
MLDKIRLHAAGRLPADYHANLGRGFDARTCAFLGVDYAALQAQTLASAPDDDASVLAWAHSRGGERTDAACDQWNRFMLKIGWRDDRSAALRERIAESGLGGRPVETFFDYIDFDEGRNPVACRAWELRPASLVVLMGVAGSGKTTVGQALAHELGWSFADADDFHPPANVAKMSAGIPLDDTDRAPWLAAIRNHLQRARRRDESAIVTCSALRERYRHALLDGVSGVTLVHLKGSPELLRARLVARTGHFMKPGMLDSQLATLEEPADAFVCDVAGEPPALVARIRRHLGL